MSMDNFIIGVQYGAAFGVLAWFGGWIVGKVIKLIRYVAR